MLGQWRYDGTKFRLPRLLRLALLGAGGGIKEVCLVEGSMQPGDVPTTYADTSALEQDFGFVPRIGLRTGLNKFIEWYKSYYKN